MNRKEKQAKKAIERLIESKKCEMPSEDTYLSQEERSIINMLPLLSTHGTGYYVRAACLVAVGLLIFSVISYFCIPPVRAWVDGIVTSIASPYKGSLSIGQIAGYETMPVTGESAMYKKGETIVVVSIEDDSVGSQQWLDTAAESFIVDGLKITDDIVTAYEKDGCYMAVVFVDRVQVWISMYNGGSEDFIAVLQSIKIER